MTIETKPFDGAKYFTAEADQIDLINDAIATGEAGYIAAAIGTVARARGIRSVAEEAGLGRQALYAALSEQGNPTLDTLVKVTGVLGLTLQVATGKKPKTGSRKIHRDITTGKVARTRTRGKKLPKIREVA